MSQKEKPGFFTMKSKSSKTKLEKSSGTSYQAIGFCLAAWQGFIALIIRLFQAPDSWLCAASFHQHDPSP